MCISEHALCLNTRIEKCFFSRRILLLFVFRVSYCMRTFASFFCLLNLSSFNARSFFLFIGIGSTAWEFDSNTILVPIWFLYLSIVQLAFVSTLFFLPFHFRYCSVLCNNRIINDIAAIWTKKWNHKKKPKQKIQGMRTWKKKNRNAKTIVYIYRTPFQCQQKYSERSKSLIASKMKWQSIVIYH